MYVRIVLSAKHVRQREREFQSSKALQAASLISSHSYDLRMEKQTIHNNHAKTDSLLMTTGIKIVASVQHNLFIDY